MFSYEWEGHPLDGMRTVHLDRNAGGGAIGRGAELIRPGTGYLSMVTKKIR